MQHNELMSSEIPTFDHLPQILNKRTELRKRTGEIFFTDDLQVLINAIKEIIKAETLSVKIGILFRLEGHTTPILIEKVVPDDEEQKENIYIYSMDSTVFDIDRGDAIRQGLYDLIRSLNEYVLEDDCGENIDSVYLFCLGYHDNDQQILKSYRRQYDIHSCATFSLLDIEIFLAEDIFNFIKDHSDVTECPYLFNLRALPPSFMYSLQSIEGKVECETVLRKGLKDFILENPISANKRTKIFAPILSFEDLQSNKDLYLVLQSMLEMARTSSTQLSLQEKIEHIYDGLSKEEEFTVKWAQYQFSLTQLCQFLERNDMRRNHIIYLYSEFYYGLFKSKFGSNIELKEHDALRLNEDIILSIADQQDRARNKSEIREKSIKTQEKLLVYGIGIIVCVLVQANLKIFQEKKREAMITNKQIHNKLLSLGFFKNNNKLRRTSFTLACNVSKKTYKAFASTLEPTIYHTNLKKFGK